MRTTDFSTVLFEGLQYAGQDRHNIRLETFSQFRDFCSARMRSVWELQNWPEVVRLATFTSTTDPVTSVPYFTPTSSEGIGEILGVFNLNPQLTTKAMSVGFELSDDGINAPRVVIGQKLLESGWYRFRIQFTPLFGDLYLSTIPYYVGAQAYFDTGSNTGAYMPIAGRPHSGNFYTCLVNANAGESPATAPAKWKKVSIPYIFGPYMSWGSAADWMVSEGNVEGAAVLEQKSNVVLDLELDKLLRQQGQFDKINMTNTY
jgi:hypothetical protein